MNKKNITNIEKIKFKCKNIGFSFQIPDSWAEVSKDSYESLGLSNNTLFIFSVDKFVNLSAVFIGFSDKRKFNRISKLKLDNNEVLYRDEDTVNDIPIKYIVIKNEKKKILNSFCLINGMIINLSINIDIKNKILDNDKLVEDDYYKVMLDLLKSIEVGKPVNPPKLLIKDDKEETVEEIIEEEVQSTAKIYIDKDCEYKNIVDPVFYMKYIYKNKKEDVQLSIIDQDIFYESKDKRIIKSDFNISNEIGRVISLFWYDLKEFDIKNKELTNKSFVALKSKYDYALIELNEENYKILKTLFKELIKLITNNKVETSYEDNEYEEIEEKKPEKKETNKSSKKETKVKNDKKQTKDYEIIIPVINYNDLKIDTKEEKEEYIDSSDVLETSLGLDQNTEENVEEKVDDKEKDLIEEEKQPVEDQIDEILNAGVEENKRNEEKDKTLISEHTVNLNEDQKYHIDIKNPEKTNDRFFLEKKREFDEFEYNLDDFEAVYHNIKGHALFKFYFRNYNFVKIIKDFNIFDVVDKFGFYYRVFIHKCDSEEEYYNKIEEWMKKNFETSNYSFSDKYESNYNGIEIRTYLLNNNRFYKFAYIDGYLIAINGYNSDSNLLDINITLLNVEIDKPNDSFIESYDRKMNSIYLLTRQDIPYIMDLPPLKSSYETRVKDFDEVAKRAIVLSIVCNFATDIINSDKKRHLKESKKFFNGLLDTYGVRLYMTHEEKELFKKMDKNLAIQISWQFEGLLILLWALGIVEEIPFPDVLVEPDELTSYISTCNNYKDFASKCLFRDVNDILDLADLTYRYDWYCVDCEAKGLEATINPEVVVERHRALNWLISDDSWDKVEINA